MASKTLQVTLTAKDNMSTTLQKAGDSAKTMGDALEQAGEDGARSISNLESEMNQVGGALAGFGIAITAALGFAVSSSMNLESAMANVNSIAQVSDEELGALTDQVLALSVEMAQSPTGLADALYNIQGSGFAADEALGILETSAVAAVAGLTDTETAARAVTAVLNAYGLEASEAGNVSDILFTAVDSGVISFAELADSLGRVLPLASSLKVPLEEISAAYAALTIQGVSASEAETGIAALLTSALNPTVALTEALDAYGVESAEALIQTEGFAGFLEFLQEASGGSTAAMSELTGNVRSTNAALALGAEDGQVYTGMIEDMAAAANDGETTLGAFAIQSDTTRFALQELGTTFEVVKIAVGDAISPFVRLGAEGLDPILQGFLALPDPVQTVVTGMTALSGGAALAGGALLLALPKIVAFQAALAALGGARGILTTVGGGLGKMTALINPWTIGIAAATTAGIAWYSTLDDGESAFDRFSAAMDDLFLDTEGQNFFENIGGAVKTFATGAAEATVGVQELEAALDGLQEAGIAAESAALLTAESSFRSAAAYAALVDAGDTRINGLTKEETALRVGVEGSKEYEQALRDIGDAYSLDQSEMGPYLEAQTAIGEAFLDEATDAKALQTELDKLVNLLGSDAITFDQFASSVVGLSQNLDDFTVANEEAASSFATLADGANLAAAAYLGMGEDVRAAEAGMAEAAQRRAEHEVDVFAAQQTRFDEERALREQRRAEEEAAHEERKARAAEFIAMGRSFGGFEDPLSTINLTGLSSQYSQLAEDIGTAGSALENTFRIIVSNTDAMGATAQATEDWILSLTQAEEGQSRLQEARSAGIITEQAYGAALGAQRDIQAANRDIQNDIVAIQANQAPLIADLTAKQAAYISTLAGLPEQQQLIALGWMDANTAAQANEAIMIAAAAANGEWGESGQAAAGQFIEGAIAANPVLEELLADIGLVARDHEGNLVIDFAGAEGAQSEIAMLTESIDALTVTMGGVPPLRVEADTGQAQQAIADVSGSLAGLAGSSAMTYMLGDNTNAQGAISTTSGSLVGLAGSSAMTYMLGTNDNALGAIGSVAAQLGGLNGDTATVYINAINNAGGVIGGVASQLANLSGRTATTYVDTVYRSRGVGMSPYAHGGMVGVPHFAGGGMVPFWAGENGPELAHFAGGGTALLPSEGLYAAPPMTYISPNNAVSTSYGGHTFNIAVNGGNRDEIRAVFADEIVPEISRAMREYERGMGVA